MCGVKNLKYERAEIIVIRSYIGTRLNKCNNNIDIDHKSCECPDGSDLQLTSGKNQCYTYKIITVIGVRVIDIL